MSIAMIFYFLLSLSVSLVVATDGSTSGTVGWFSDPAGRGTFSLIFSCVLTLGLCVWSAMHLNIPPHDESHAQSWWRNIKWGVIGIFAPELVVFAAWRQYNSAKSLQTEVNRQLDAMEVQSSLSETSESQLKNPTSLSRDESAQSTSRWTMVHGFYAGMGGFTFDAGSFCSDNGMPFIPYRHRLTLTARGVAFLARCGHLPNMKKKDIIDKSKADSLAKSLACLQASWMVVQVIGRAILGLHVTLLEVNTLGHVLCALLTYLLWWNKPRQIYEPTNLEGKWVGALCAYMYMSSQISGRRSAHAALLRRTWYDPELSYLAFIIPGTPTEPSKAANKVSQDRAREDILTRSPNTAQIFHRELSTFISSNEQAGVALESGRFGMRLGQTEPEDHEGGFSSSGEIEQADNPASMRVLRWQLAEKAVHHYPSIQQRLTTMKQDATLGHAEVARFESVTEELLTTRVANWPSEDLLRGTGGLVMGMILWFASMAFGAVHLAAWHEYFPSTVEAWMWRSSSMYITWSGLLRVTINLLAHLSAWINEYWERVIAFQASRASCFVVGLLCSTCGIAYVFARVFLVVEAIISIRQLPLTAYMTPDWTQIIPHL